MPRSFLYVVLVVFAAVASAFSYRLYQEGQSRLSVVDSHEQTAPLAEGGPAERLPSARPVILVE
ncbi:MAG: hypothetical protein H6R00_3516 [Proteobacteria bacterium]|nr:hypothetical protein [Pseudomonadota bacterium]